MILRFNHNRINIFLEYIVRQPEFISQSDREDYYDMLKEYNEDNGYEITALEERTKLVFVFCIFKWADLGNGNNDFEFLQLEVYFDKDRTYNLKRYTFNQISNDEYINEKETPDQDPYIYYLRDGETFDEGFFEGFNLDEQEVMYNDEVFRKKWIKDTSLRRACLRTVNDIFVEVIDNYYEEVK